MVRCLLYGTNSETCLLLQIQTYTGIFTSYSDIFSHIVACLEPCVTVAYLKPCHIQNPEIFRIQDIFRTLLRHILVYSERLRNARLLRTPPIFRTLPYLEFWHV